jgi:hypothetical protein
LSSTKQFSSPFSESSRRDLERYRESTVLPGAQITSTTYIETKAAHQRQPARIDVQQALDLRNSLKEHQILVSKPPSHVLLIEQQPSPTFSNLLIPIGIEQMAVTEITQFQEVSHISIPQHAPFLWVPNFS